MVTQGDTIRFPFLMHGVVPGDTLRLNRATLLGSRDYTLKAGEAAEDATVKPGAQGTGHRAEKQAWLDERLFTCRATVLGVESEPLRIKEKTKRRQRHVRRIQSKHRYTVVRISELAVSDVEALREGSIGQGEEALNELEDKLDA
jgi:large subunit ribosomal protein L21